MQSADTVVKLKREWVMGRIGETGPNRTLWVWLRSDTLRTMYIYQYILPHACSLQLISLFYANKDKGIRKLAIKAGSSLGSGNNTCK